MNKNKMGMGLAIYVGWIRMCICSNKGNTNSSRKPQLVERIWQMENNMNLKTILSWAFDRVTCHMCVKLNGALLERKSHVTSYTLDIAVHVSQYTI